LLDYAAHIVVLIGTGASVGQDFRFLDGIYDTIRESGVLSKPCKIFNLTFFLEDPSIFRRFAKLAFLVPTPEFSSTHFFFEAFEEQRKFLRSYLQNVDTLEHGISPGHLRCAHGS